MADVSNLKINERLNVKQPNLRVTKIGNKHKEVKASKLIYVKQWKNYEKSRISNGRTIPIFANFWSQILVF